MGFIKEFREFALKGNMLDLAVGVIIGAAFGGIVQSLIKDVIMPVVGLAGNVDFSDAKVLLKAKDQANPKSADIFLSYGNFVTVAINFLILAFCIFLVVKAFNIARKKFEKEQAPPPPAGPSSTDKLLMEIRDALKAGR